MFLFCLKKNVNSTDMFFLGKKKLSVDFHVINLTLKFLSQNIFVIQSKIVIETSLIINRHKIVMITN
jgi:hypothetical protein